MTTKNSIKEELDKEFPQCDCKNNMAPHFADSKVNRNWVNNFYTSKIKTLLSEILPEGVNCSNLDEVRKNIKLRGF